MLATKEIGYYPCTVADLWANYNNSMLNQDTYIHVGDLIVIKQHSEREIEEIGADICNYGGYIFPVLSVTRLGKDIFEYVVSDGIREMTVFDNNIELVYKRIGTVQ